MQAANTPPLRIAKRSRFRFPWRQESRRRIWWCTSRWTHRFWIYLDKKGRTLELDGVGAFVDDDLGLKVGKQGNDLVIREVLGWTAGSILSWICVDSLSTFCGKCRFIMSEQIESHHFGNKSYILDIGLFRTNNLRSFWRMGLGRLRSFKILNLYFLTIALRRSFKTG